MQIEPQVTIPLVYQLADPYDTATYYVRAVIIDPIRNETLDTVELVDNGSGRFTSSFQSPSDPSGAGRLIDATISVYTDSGYTTYSDTYQKENRHFIVKKSTPSFGGSSVDIDYEKIRKMIAETLKTHMEEMSKNKPADLSGDIMEIKKMVGAIEIPEYTPSVVNVPPQTPVDLSPITNAIKSLENVVKEVTATVNNIEIPTPPALDPVLSSLKTLEGVISSYNKAQGDKMDNLSQKLLKDAENRISKAREAVMNMIDSGAVSKDEKIPSPMAKYFK